MTVCIKQSAAAVTSIDSRINLHHTSCYIIIRCSYVLVKCTYMTKCGSLTKTKCISDCHDTLTNLNIIRIVNSSNRNCI